MKKWRHFLHHMGIKNRAVLYVSVLIIVTIIIGVLGFSVIYHQRAMADNREYAEKSLHNLETHLDTYCDEIAAIANETNFDYYLQNFLKEMKEEDEDSNSLRKGKSIQNHEMSTKLFSYAINNRVDVSSIMVFGKKRMLLYKSLYDYRNIVRSYPSYEWYQKALQAPGHIVVTGPQNHEFLEGNTEPTLSFSQAITSYEDGAFMGVVLIDVNLNEIEEICKSSVAENETNLCILNEKQEVLYEKNREGTPYQLEEKETLEKLQQAVAVSSKEKELVTLSGKKYQMVVQSMDETGWSLVSLTPSAVILKPIEATLWAMIVTGLLGIILVILALNRVLNRVVQPIIILKRSMDQAEASNLTTRVNVDSGDEIEMLARSYNKMMDRIEHLMKQVVDEQEEKRKYELQVLQAQINPHFLYNTLDSIIWMAETKNDKVVEMTEALAKLFRISLNNGKEFISLEKELEHVRNYLVIQSMRYANKFTYTIAIADEIRNYQTIKLMIQPLVENAIYHGIKMQKKKGKIEILAYQKENRIFIEVVDDGPGMQQELCDSILEEGMKRENITGSGVGVRNVNERIQLYFGTAYGLHFESVMGKGTKVTIVLPGISKPLEKEKPEEREKKHE